MTTVRTRFAPSPTGYLHIGGVRTALYCWLYAKKHHGKFILRIEDTDRERSTDAAVQAILASMQWLGLDWDEGPFYQTKRFERYQEVIQYLLDSGHAYRCYCSKERLETLRNNQMNNKEKPRYDGHCRQETNPQTGPYVIRFKNPTTGTVEFNDAIRGLISIQNSELDDLILVRSDGVPTYNFAVVIDDIDMNISLVMRGEDHIANTPRQINIFKALNAKIPEFAHIPMILGDDGKRLSKRHGAVSVLHYKQNGFLPEALLNYLVRLGWSHGDQEIFSLQELSTIFDLRAINRSAAIFNQEKLLWLNQHYLKTLPVEYLANQLAWHFKELKINTTNGPSLPQLILAQRERAKTLVELAEKSRYFYEDFPEFDEKAAKKQLTTTAAKALQLVFNQCQQLTTWQANQLHSIIHNTAEQLAMPLGKIAQPIRVAVTGNTISPPIDITLELLGKSKVLQRLEKALAYINNIASKE